MNIVKNDGNRIITRKELDSHIRNTFLHPISISQTIDPSANGWVEVAPAIRASCNIRCVVAYDGKIYGASSGSANEGALLEWNGTDAWAEVADTYNDGSTGLEYAIQSLIVYSDKIYAGTAVNGYLLEWNGTDAWAKVADTLNFQDAISSLCEYAGDL